MRGRASVERVARCLAGRSTLESSPTRASLRRRTVSATWSSCHVRHISALPNSRFRLLCRNSLARRLMTTQRPAGTAARPVQCIGVQDPSGRPPDATLHEQTAVRLHRSPDAVVHAGRSRRPTSCRRGGRRRAGRCDRNVLQLRQRVPGWDLRPRARYVRRLSHPRRLHRRSRLRRVTLRRTNVLHLVTPVHRARLRHRTNAVRGVRGRQ